MGFVEMGEHLCSVNTLPIEGVIWERVGVVPIYFGCQEIINTAAFHNLRDCGAVAEGIGQPETVGGEVEMLSCESLTPKKLSYHRFTRGYVAVAFNPNAAVGLISAFRNLLFDVLKK